MNDRGAMSILLRLLVGIVFAAVLVWLVGMMTASSVIVGAVALLGFLIVVFAW